MLVCGCCTRNLCSFFAQRGPLLSSSVLGKVEETIKTIYASVMPTQLGSLGKDLPYFALLCVLVFLFFLLEQENQSLIK